MGTITCELQASYAATAGDDKAKLVGKLGTTRPHKQQRWLTFAGNGKGKGRRLGDGGTPAGPWYGGTFLRRRTNVAGGGGGMQVFVRTLAGKSLALHVSPSDTVDALKARIQAKERVAAGDQRLVFAGRDLDDGRRTLAQYGVRKEANLFLHLRLRGGAGGAGGGGGGSRQATVVVGVLTTVVAVGAALAYLPLPAAAAGTGGLALASLLLAWAIAMAGVNLITAGVFLTGSAETLCCTVQTVLSKSSAFVRRNLGVLGVAAASSAATGVILSAADRVLCFISFALLLAAMTLVVIGVASCASS